MLTHEELFALTVEDLRNKIANGNEYNIIRACGLCRHLLTDQHPLLHLANKNHKLDVRFHVADYSDMEIFGLDFFPIQWSTIEPHFTAPKSKCVNLKEFLSIRLLKFYQHNYTVGDMIRAASHFMGGIHSGRPEDKKEEALIALDKAALSDEKLTFRAIKATCKVVLKSLEPLEQKIRESTK